MLLVSSWPSATRTKQKTYQHHMSYRLWRCVQSTNPSKSIEGIQGDVYMLLRCGIVQDLFYRARGLWDTSLSTASTGIGYLTDMMDHLISDGKDRATYRMLVRTTRVYMVESGRNFMNSNKHGKGHCAQVSKVVI